MKKYSRPCSSPGRGCLVVQDTECHKLGTMCTICLHNVVFPVPEGADTIYSKPRRSILGRHQTFRRSKGLGDEDGGGYSIFCTCSRIFSSTVFICTTVEPIPASLALDPSVFTSLPISCNRKSKVLPTVPDLASVAR